MSALSSAPALAPLQAENRVSQAGEALREFILKGELKSGDELPSQGELCQRLGVSRTVIREAMQQLASQGLIEISQGKRPRISPPSTGVVVDGLGTLLDRSQLSLLEVLQARRPLEIEAARLAAKHAGSEHFEAMEAANRDLAQARTIEAQIDADQRFHLAVAEATGNPVFGILLNVLGQFLFESRRKTLRRSGAQVALRHHRSLLKALRSGDTDAAARAAEAGMAQTGRDLRSERA